MLANRLTSNHRHLKKWARREGVTCYRLYDHDIPEYPLIVDLYEQTVVVYISNQKGEDGDFVDLIAQEIQSALGLREMVVKERGRRPGGTPLPGASGQAEFSIVHEGGLNFEVHLRDHHDTGLFLDHRKTRRWLADRCAGGRVLNLFCYTGSFSVYAARAGARMVTSLDLSRTYLDWAERNFSLNCLPARDHRFVQTDVLRWLDICREEFDWIVCDPPTFSNSKRMASDFDIARDHPVLIRACLERLAPGGTLLFSTNDRGFRLDPNLQLDEITEQTRSEDFRRGGGHRCWVHRRDSPSR